MKDIEGKLAAFLMDYGVLKNADAEKMAKRIAGMFEKERDQIQANLTLSDNRREELRSLLKLAKEERDQLAAKCAELKELIRIAFEDCSTTDTTQNGCYEVSADAMLNLFQRSRSDDCGNGWLSPEKAERLMGYAAHRPNCTIMDFPAGSKPCNCGLSEALSETK